MATHSPEVDADAGGDDPPPASDDLTVHHLVQSHLRFVMKVANGYKNLGVPFEDLVNEGTIGLIEAARRFDPHRGARFITYANWWIRKSMLQAVQHSAALVHIPEHSRRQLRALAGTGRALTRELGREAGREEIARAMRLTLAQTDRLLQRKPRELSLDDKVSDDRDTRLLDRLADERTASPEDRMIRLESVGLLRVALRTLSEVQLSVIVSRFGLAGDRPRTLRQLGARLGMSRERVRQIEVQAMKKLWKAVTRSRRERLPVTGSPRHRMPAAAAMTPIPSRSRPRPGTCATG